MKKYLTALLAFYMSFALCAPVQPVNGGTGVINNNSNTIATTSPMHLPADINLQNAYNHSSVPHITGELVLDDGSNDEMLIYGPYINTTFNSDVGTGIALGGITVNGQTPDGFTETAFLKADFVYEAAGLNSGRLLFNVTDKNNPLSIGYMQGSSPSYGSRVGFGDSSTNKISNFAINLGAAEAVNANALVQINSTTQGFLPPQMTTAQMNAIPAVSIDAGLTVYVTDGVSGEYIWDGAGWNLTGGGSGGGDLQAAYDAGNEIALTTGSPVLISTQGAPINFAVYSNSTTSYNYSSVEAEQFTSSQNGFVTALQYEDPHFVGGAGATREVGIYRSSDLALIAAALVSKSDPLDGTGFYRTHAITPVPIVAGVTYMVVGVVPANELWVFYARSAPSPFYYSGISYGQASTSLVPPTTFSPTSNLVYYGNQSFQFTPLSSTVSFNDSTNNSLFTVSSTVQGSVPSPVMTTSQFTALPHSIGLTAFDSVLHRPTLYDGVNTQTVAFTSDITSTDLIPQGTSNKYLSINGGSTYENVAGSLGVNNLIVGNTAGGQIADSHIAASNVVQNNGGLYNLSISGNAATATSSTTATNANNVATTQVSSNASYYPLMASSSMNSNQAPDLAIGLTYNPSTNVLTTTTFSGALNGNASTVTTNANLTGPVTSIGNATAVTAASITNAMLAGGIDLTSKVTGILPTLNGGTGSGATFTLGSVPYAGVAGAFTQSNANFFLDGTNYQLWLGANTSTQTFNGVGRYNSYVTTATNGINESYYTSIDGYPAISISANAHDDMVIDFDAYASGINTKSSNAGSNFQIRKNSNTLSIYNSSGNAQGANLAWNGPAIQFDASNHVILPVLTGPAVLSINGSNQITTVGGLAASYVLTTDSSKNLASSNTARVYPFGTTTPTLDANADTGITSVSSTANTVSQLAVANSTLNNFIMLWSGRSSDVNPVEFWSSGTNLRFGTSTAGALNTGGFSQLFLMGSNGIFTANSGLTATSGNITATNGNFVIGTNNEVLEYPNTDGDKIWFYNVGTESKIDTSAGWSTNFRSGSTGSASTGIFNWYTVNGSSAWTSRMSLSNAGVLALTGGTLSISSAGNVAATIASTTTGSTNNADLFLSRGDQANGFDRIVYRTGSTSNWSVGNRSAVTDYTVFDEANALAQLTMVQGSGTTGTNTFAGSVIANALTLNSTGGTTISMGNNSQLQAKNSGGTLETVLYPRYTDNAVYLSGGAGGMHLRVSNTTDALVFDSTGNATLSAGNLLFNTIGTTITDKTGTNACAGSGAVMIAGAVTVSTTCAKTGDIILLMKSAAGGTSTTGMPVVTIVNATSFTITGGGLDTSTWSWEIHHTQ